MQKLLPGKEIDFSVFWKPSKIWAGETVFVIGGGPSLKEFDWDLMSKYKCIGANDAYRLGPFVDYCLFGDACWLQLHREDIRSSTAKIVGVLNTPIPKHDTVYWLKRVQGKMGDVPGEIGWFGNTGMSAICLAVQLGAAKICLLGFDMKVQVLDEDTKKMVANWHLNPLASPNPKSYVRFLVQGKRLVRDLETRYPEVEVINCNTDSAWDVFPKMTVEEALNG